MDIDLELNSSLLFFFDCMHASGFSYIPIVYINLTDQIIGMNVIAKDRVDSFYIIGSISQT